MYCIMHLWFLSSSLVKFTRNVISWNLHILVLHNEIWTCIFNYDFMSLLSQFNLANFLEFAYFKSMS